MTEAEYFEFCDQYLKLFAAQRPRRVKMVVDPKLTKL